MVYNVHTIQYTNPIILGHENPGAALDFASYAVCAFITHARNCGSKVSACFDCANLYDLCPEITYLLLYWKETHRDGSTAAGGEGEEAVRAAARGRGPGQLQAGADARPDGLHLPGPAGDYCPGMMGSYNPRPLKAPFECPYFNCG